MVTSKVNTFKGNKAALPQKRCEACGRIMTYRKCWARVWAEVRFCSDRCRMNKKKTPPPPSF